jgi:uncharacterized membrane protein
LKNSVIETEKSDEIDEIFYVCSVVRSMFIFFSSLDVMIRNILELQKKNKKKQKEKRKELCCSLTYLIMLKYFIFYPVNVLDS